MQEHHPTFWLVEGTGEWTKAKTLDTGHYGGGEMFVALDWRWTVLYHRAPSFLTSLLLSVECVLTSIKISILISCYPAPTWAAND